MERIYGAFKTGMVMSLTTLVAVITALMITQSEIIRQIMIILLIGLLVDLINTWIQNVGLLRLYLEKKEKKMQHHE
jgi:preprotein translocase subunit SecF